LAAADRETIIFAQNVDRLKKYFRPARIAGAQDNRRSAPPWRGPRAPSSAQRQQLEPQRENSSFFRRASREEVEEQAAERMEVIALKAAEAKADAEERAARAPPKRPPGRPRKKSPTRVD
jgi:hypothetical protein